MVRKNNHANQQIISIHAFQAWNRSEGCLYQKSQFSEFLYHDILLSNTNHVREGCVIIGPLHTQEHRVYSASYSHDVSIVVVVLPHNKIKENSHIIKTILNNAITKTY